MFPSTTPTMEPAMVIAIPQGHCAMRRKLSPFPAKGAGGGSHGLCHARHTDARPLTAWLINYMSHRHTFKQRFWRCNGKKPAARPDGTSFRVTSKPQSERRSVAIKKWNQPRTLCDMKPDIECMISLS